MTRNSTLLANEDIKFLLQDICTLKGVINTDIINSADVAYVELTKKMFKLMEKAVFSVHANSIQSGTIIKKGKEKTYYQTRVPGLKTPPRTYSYESLIEKLYEHYFADEIRKEYSFETIFNAALEEKIRTEAPKEKTIRDYHNSYNVLITSSFGERDIREITSIELKEYIQTTTRELALTKKRFYKLKGVLNLAFNYASAPEHDIIPRNIVPTGVSGFKNNIRQVTCKPQDKAFQPDDIKMIREHLWDRVTNRKYDVNAFAILFSSHTGIRQAEIPSLKWSDIDNEDNIIHIHSQQNDELRNGVRHYYYNPTTKNEKGESQDGRYIPLTEEVAHILTELKNRQDALGISSEWVFARENGEWITTDSYYKSLRRLCKRLNLALCNNHAFRIAYNSYVLIPLGIDAPERARMLGHSVETNLRHYTFSRDKEYLKEIKGKLDIFNSNNLEVKGVNRG